MKRKKKYWRETCQFINIRNIIPHDWNANQKTTSNKLLITFIYAKYFFVLVRLMFCHFFFFSILAWQLKYIKYTQHSVLKKLHEEVLSTGCYSFFSSQNLKKIKTVCVFVIHYTNYKRLTIYVIIWWWTV